MPHAERFIVSDQYIAHVDGIIDDIDDPLVKARYAGFLAVTAVTVFELAFKDILFDFADRKHAVFGSHVRASYERLNGRISISDIKKSHVRRFGDKYSKRFDKVLSEKEKESLSQGEGSITASYGNLVTWRHGFVHNGELPNTATYDEARKNYFLGKKLFDCLAAALKR